MTKDESLSSQSPQTEEFGEFGELKTKKYHTQLIIPIGNN